MPARSALGAVVAHTVRPASECHAHGEEEPRASGGEVDQQQAHEHRWREGHGEAHVAERDTIRPGRVWFSAPQCDQREEEQQGARAVEEHRNLHQLCKWQHDGHREHETDDDGRCARHARRRVDAGQRAWKHAELGRRDREARRAAQGGLLLAGRSNADELP